MDYSDNQSLNIDSSDDGSADYSSFENYDSSDVTDDNDSNASESFSDIVAKGSNESSVRSRGGSRRKRYILFKPKKLKTTSTSPFGAAGRFANILFKKFKIKTATLEFAQKISRSEFGKTLKYRAKIVLLNPPKTIVRAGKEILLKRKSVVKFISPKKEKELSMRKNTEKALQTLLKTSLSKRKKISSIAAAGGSCQPCRPRTLFKINNKI